MRRVEVPAHIDALQVEGERLAAAAARAGPGTAVPTCPGWTIRDLVHHVGGVHRWAAILVGEARREAVEDDDLERLSGGWPDDERLLEWFRAGHAALVRALREAPPDLRCFTFLPAPSPLAMWARRQAHETAVHRLDAEAALGPVTPLEPELAADGIDELLTCFVTRPNTGLRLDRARAIGVEAVDQAAAWVVRIGPPGIRTLRAVPSGDEDLRLTGTAGALHLLLWNRGGLDDITWSGDPELLALWGQRVRIRW